MLKPVDFLKKIHFKGKNDNCRMWAKILKSVFSSLPPSVFTKYKYSVERKKKSDL